MDRKPKIKKGFIENLQVSIYGFAPSYKDTEEDNNVGCPFNLLKYTAW